MHRVRQAALPLLAAALVLTQSLLSACTSAEPPTTATGPADTGALKFAMVPSTENPEILLQTSAVADLIAEATGRKIETQNPADYMAVVESVRAGFTDLALTSQFATALAYENGSVTPIIVWDQEQAPASLCFVRADSEIRTLDEFAGGQIAFVDPGSTTGYFLPKSMLTQHGFIDGRDYSSTFAGSHETALLAMLNGTVDMACVARQLVPIYLEQGLLGAGRDRQLIETASIPLGISVVVSEGVDRDTRQRLIDHLPEAMMAEEELASLYGGASSYQINPDKSVYEPILQIARDAGANLEDLR